MLAAATAHCDVQTYSYMMLYDICLHSLLHGCALDVCEVDVGSMVAMSCPLLACLIHVTLQASAHKP